MFLKLFLKHCVPFNSILPGVLELRLWKKNGIMSDVFQKCDVGSGRFLHHEDICNGEGALEVVASSGVKKEDTI